MIDLTPEANARFERYLERLRSALRGSRAVAATEVEQDVREHVEMALAGIPGPVTAERLDQVLDQLGAPDRWLTDDDRPWWRRLAHRFTSGPEDWRLTYLAFSVFALAIFLMSAGVGLILLLFAFLLSRAAVETIAERGEPLGARRWLVLPAIWVGLLLVAVLIAIVPVVGLSTFAISDGGIEILGIDRTGPGTLSRVRVTTGFIAVTAGVWWLVLSAVFTAALRPFRAMFLPVTATLSRRHAVVLALVGAIVATLGALLLGLEVASR